MNDTDKLIQDQFNSLPPAVKESISSVPWRERVRNIAKREGLDADKSEALEAETMMILFGFQSADDYTQNIVGQVGLEEEAAERITKEVSDEILVDIEKQFEMIDAISHKDKVAAPEITHVPAAMKPSTPSTQSPATPTPSSTLEILPNNLPEVLPGQVTHDVPRVAPASIAPVAPQPIAKNENGRPNLEFPQSGYQKGKDPYREPIE